MSRSIIMQHCEAPRRSAARRLLPRERRALLTAIRTAARRRSPLFPQRLPMRPHEAARIRTPSSRPSGRPVLEAPTCVIRYPRLPSLAASESFSTLAASKLDPSPVLLYGLAVLGAMLI